MDSPRISPEHAQLYCQWAGRGQVLISEELTQVLDIGVIPSGSETDSPTSLQDNGVIPNDLSMGFRCAVENPAPQPAFCESPAFYGNGLPAEMGEGTTHVGDFCQSGKSYATFDLALPENASVQSLSENCDSAGGNRVACTGNPGAAPAEAWVSIRCDMMGSAFECPTGFSLDTQRGALCTFTGEGLSSTRSPHLALVTVNPLLDPPPGGCGIGYYYDPALAQCVSLEGSGTSPSAQCMQGFEMDSSRNCCVSKLPSENYPGCPPGVAVDPATGACDFQRLWVDNGTALEVINFDVTIQSCSALAPSGGGSGGGTQGVRAEAIPARVMATKTLAQPQVVVGIHSKTSVVS